MMNYISADEQRDRTIKRQSRWLSSLVIIVGLQFLALLGMAIWYPNIHGVIELDSTGKPVGMVAPIYGLTSLNDVAIRGELTEFIRSALTITGNRVADVSALKLAYAYADDRAGKELTAFLHDPANDPFELGEHNTQHIEIGDILKTGTAGQYQADFRVVRYPNLGGSPTKLNWRGLFRLAAGPVTNANPFGLYITSIDWSVVK